MRRTKQSAFAKRERREPSVHFDPTGEWAEHIHTGLGPFLADRELAALNALDPALKPICVEFKGMQECSNHRSFGLYNIEEAIDDNLVLHSTVSLQTLAVYGFRPVMV